MQAGAADMKLAGQIKAIKERIGCSTFITHLISLGNTVAKSKITAGMCGIGQNSFASRWERDLGE